MIAAKRPLAACGNLVPSMRSNWLRGPLTIFCCLIYSVAMASPNSGTCATDKRLSGPCFMIRGRLSLSNGNPSVRIWVVGTSRILGVSEGRFPPEDYSGLPQQLGSLKWDINYFGDYTVCPFESDTPGVMRLVCVDSVEHLILRQRE
jgi:hypothetical protein